ncbi:MAG: hypothetical protein IJU19_07900 [Bacteroidales bacterium]|nr:hypothetical protein [Bacteroidales bacterium]
MRRRLSFLVITVFSLAAVSLIIIQFVQTRRTFSISDNMFNVSVNNAVDEVIQQLGGDMPKSGDGHSGAFSFQELDSLVAEELLINGIDIHPAIGIYDGYMGSFLYSSDPAKEDELEVSPYRYTFGSSIPTVSNQTFLILCFPRTELFLQRNTRLYTYISLFLILVIATMFIISLRTISVQRKLDQMKSEFINNMTHEIKTPISTIALACEMLKDRSINQDAASRDNFIDIIDTENHRMRILAETILLSAKMSNRNFSLNIRPVDIHPVVERVVQSFQLAVGNRGGQLEVHLDARPSVINADELHLTNLIYNLVDNGVKYSVGKPHITISTERQGDMLLLRIRDRGIGIDKADQKHIFEKFYRVSTGDVHDVKGFGIGLNYVAQVVNLHHGHISLESELGQGSVFTVSFPALPE